MEAHLTSVPCGSCHLCCHTIITLADDEYHYAWTMQVIDGRVQRILCRQPNGDCIYLQHGKCSIHGRAPKVCRDFDCRDLVRKPNPKVPAEVVARGKELLEHAD